MPGEDIYSWSTTAANNDDADTSINWREGMARAAVNDSSRSSMAAVAKFRDLLKGTIVTSGTTDAQTFTSGIGYSTVPTGLRALLKIGPGLTNTTATTLSMDGITAAPVKNKAGAALVGGELVADGYVEVIYDGTNWILAADGKEKVNRSGDTMTGALTVNSSITATGTIAASGIVYATGGVTATGDVMTFGSLRSGTGNCFLEGTVPQLTMNDNGAFVGIQNTNSTITMGTANSDGAIVVNRFYFHDNGSFEQISGAAYKPGGGSWTDSSDARIKNIVGNYTSGLAEIVQMQPVRYSFKGNDTKAAPEPGDTAPYKTSSHHMAATEGDEFIGVVAQDVEQYLPELVTQSSGYIDGAAVGDIRRLDTSPLVYALVNSIKELLQRIEALEAKG